MADGQNHTNPLFAFGNWLAEAPKQWPSEAIESARRQFIDVIGVTLAGALEPVSTKVASACVGWGQGPCTIIGSANQTSAPWAAMANGTAAHALDFDDNFDPAKAHATAVLAPAILALAEETDLSGEAVIDAYIAGLQILGRVGQGLNPAHRNRGWHATATVGAIGAAAACSRLLGSDARTSAHALSLATSMAAGSMVQFGTMAKPLHAGLAAKAGVIAAQFARMGIDASVDALDGPTGMQRLMVGPDLDELREKLTDVEHGQTLSFETANVGEPLLILEHGFRVKAYPNCGSAHRAIDGLLELKEKHGFSAGDVATIGVFAPTTHLANLMYEAPETGIEAQFSLEYGLATALLHGDCRLADFTDAAVWRPDIRALFSHIVRHPVDRPEGVFPTRVEVELNDGRQYATEVAMPKGSRASPFPIERYWRKLSDCAAAVIPPAQLDGLRDALDALPTLQHISQMVKHLRVCA